MVSIGKVVCAVLSGLVLAVQNPNHFCSARPSVMAPSWKMLFLVPTPAPVLTYHGGQLITDQTLQLHVVWYGAFTAALQERVAGFISSFPATASTPSTVAEWWKTMKQYKDSSNAAAAPEIALGNVFKDVDYSKGKNLTSSDLAAMADAYFAGGEKTRTSSMYVLITADDVQVQDFCMGSCGSHGVGASSRIPFVWVGNAGRQCPGLCAWPFAKQEDGPARPPLVSPSGDVATDGIIIILATLLPGAVSNPFASGYFEGDAAVPLEAGTACQGLFGAGSYPGYAGKLQTDASTGASFNAVGINGLQFLLPALWSPSTGVCQTTP